METLHPHPHHIVIRLLNEKRDVIIREAVQSLQRSHLSGYERDGLDVATERLDHLLDMAIQALQERQLDEIRKNMESIASARYTAGYDLAEVQTAINVLEESIWRNILPSIPPAEMAEALGLVGTVLGTAKDTLARAYVVMAGQAKVKSLNMEALFRGTSGV